MKKKLLMLGAKGVAKITIEAAEAGGMFSQIALLDTYADYDNLLSYPIIGKCDDFEKYREEFSHAYVCMADSKLRKEFTQKLVEAGFNIPNIIHPRAYVSRHATLGMGVVLDANVTIGPDSKIGDGCIFHGGTSISHDNEVGEYCFFAYNIATNGSVRIGDNTFVGASSCIKNDVNIGNNVLVAAGSVVIEDVPDNVMVAGVPAKIKKEKVEIKTSVWPNTYKVNRE